MNPVVIVALVVGALIGLACGLRMGAWWGFFRLGQFELHQRIWRASRWRRGY